jgi:hypothetical protein
LVNFLNKNPEIKIIGISHAKLAKFFDFGQTTFILILYTALLVVIYLRSKIKIELPLDVSIEKSLYIILVPMTVISIVLTLQIALMGIKVLDISQLAILTNGMQGDNYAYKFISLTPLRTFLHGIATILITSELNVSFRSKSFN